MVGEKGEEGRLEVRMRFSIGRVVVVEAVGAASLSVVGGCGRGEEAAVGLLSASPDGFTWSVFQALSSL